MSNSHQTHHNLNQQQYSDKAHHYLTSLVHAQGIEFAKMQEYLQLKGVQSVLDLGCGGGHVSYHLAPAVSSVTAYDLTPSMIELVLTEARQRNLDNISGKVGCAESLPFADNSFDAIVTRYSAHHWQSLPKALMECHRVLKPQGSMIIVDTLGHAHPVFNNFLQTIETIRDPSHVRNYHLAEWTNFVEMVGFDIIQIDRQRLALEFNSWTARMHTPADSISTIRRIQQCASVELTRHYDVQADGSFTNDVLYMVLMKA